MKEEEEEDAKAERLGEEVEEVEVAPLGRFLLAAAAEDDEEDDKVAPGVMFAVGGR